MPVKKNPAGRRSIQVEAEVPGTLQQVWDAIATAPGISAWFVPARFEGVRNGAPTHMILNFGPGMDSESSVTAWEPLRRFSAQSSEREPGAAPMVTEWSVEARAGGTCLVRVVHSMATTSDAWDKELEAIESGWPGFFRILRLYLTHFPGQEGHAIRGMAMAGASEAEVWAAFTQSLGIAATAPGQRVSASGAGAPPFAGVIEHASHGPHSSLLLRLEQPAAGIAAFGAFNCGGAVMISLCLNFFGSAAQSTAGQYDPQWQAWLAKLFPPSSGAGA